MPTQVTATEAARNLSDLLNRIRYRGEMFDITRNGEVVARMGAPAGAQPRTSMRELSALLEALRVDDAFADDLERVQAAQPPLPDEPWAT